MWRTTLLFGKTSGFYIAQHPIISKEQLVKVGFSRALEARLHMTNYITCFPPGWSFFATVECTPKNAQVLESAVLALFDAKRVANRELLEADPEQVLRATTLLMKKLSTRGKLRRSPTYELVRKRMRKATSQAAHADVLRPLTQRRAAAIEQAVHHVRGILEPSSTTSTAFVPDAQQKLHTLLVSTEATPRNESTEGEETGTEDELLSVVSNQVDCGPEMAAAVEHVGGAPAATSSTKATAQGVELRDYQQHAVQRASDELSRVQRTIVQMACRSGKTAVAHRIILSELKAKLVNNGAAACCVLVLVPSLALLRQTALKLSSYGLPQEARMLLVGSAPDAIHLHSSGGDATYMTTSPSEIAALVDKNPVTIIVSTYYSSAVVVSVFTQAPELQQRLSLVVFDEAHRVCGQPTLSPFNAALLTPALRSAKSLFLTATPVYDAPLRMDNHDLFGGIAYRFYLREGINRGFVNPFSLEIVLGNFDEMELMVAVAMNAVDKMLVFCKNIDHAEELADRIARYVSVSSEARESSNNQPATVRPFECFCAHSRLGSAEVGRRLRAFIQSPRAVLVNVRLFQEGVEIPDLNAVFFASPRYSPRDIIQSVCRPLNVLPGKPPSKVFLPAHHDFRLTATNPINLQSFSTLVPFTDALLDEDPQLFEYLMDPHKCSYNLKILGTRELRGKDGSQRYEALLPHLRRGVRYSAKDTDRLGKADRLPWKLAFAELARIVHTCHRYPKTNDAWVVGDARISLYRFYRYVREAYQLHVQGQPTPLQVHQLRDLESLPYWTTYGLSGPYPWAECFQTLTSYVEQHGRFPPLDIHKGGYVGLDATPFERLAGALCHINQHDKHTHLSVSASRAADLDSLCNAHGLQWRKPRLPNGRLRSRTETSCITQCYQEFKKLYEAKSTLFDAYLREHFPGYPEKHLRMERLEVQASGVAPPRLKRRSMKQIARMARTGSADLLTHVVFCRQCRVEVNPADWSTHLQSAAHQKHVIESQRVATLP